MNVRRRKRLLCLGGGERTHFPHLGGPVLPLEKQSRELVKSCHVWAISLDSRQSGLIPLSKMRVGAVKPYFPPVPGLELGSLSGMKLDYRRLHCQGMLLYLSAANESGNDKLLTNPRG